MRKRLMLKLAASAVTVCGLLFFSKTSVFAGDSIAVIGSDNNSYICTGGKLNTDYNGMATDKKGKKYWFDYGVMAQDKQVYDFDTDAWYWFDADGTMAVNKDVYIPLSNEDRSQGKWVRYDENGGMVKGEDFRYGGWYYFDVITGEMIKGFTNIPDETEYGKWVYYDEINGKMHHGNSVIDSKRYHFDEYTGKMTHGEYCDRLGKWYYYDEITGIMHTGEVFRNGNRYYYDETSGQMCKGFAKCGDEWNYYDDITGVYAPEENYDSGKKAAAFALSKIGYPYSQELRDSGDYFDCSSLAYYSWKSAGISIRYKGATTAAAEAEYCYDNGKLTDYDSMQPGDLIFYSYYDNDRFMNISHVAVYVGNGNIVEAANAETGVVYRPVSNKSYIVLIGHL